MKVAVISEEPTEYTLDLIAGVFRPRGIDTFWKDAIGFRAIVSILGSHDVVVVNGYTGWRYWLLFAANAAFFRRDVGIDSDSQPETPKNPVRRFLKKVLLGWLYARRWCWGLAGGTGGHRRAFSMYGMEDRRIFLNPMVSRKESPDALSRNDGKFRFGYVGRLVPHKRVGPTLEAWKNAAIPDSEFTVVGDGCEGDRLRGDFPGVRFTGRLSGRELAREMASLDCLVLCSAYEPWGLVVNEALAFGVPVIVSDRVGAREDLVEGRNTGYVVPCDDQEALSSAMRRMVTEAKGMRPHCLEVASKWDMRFYAKCWDEWIRCVARESPVKL